MNDALVYITAISFFISIFPVHILNYVYASTEQKYFSVNVTLYRIVTIFNFNTEQIKVGNAEPKKKKIMTPENWLKMYNNLCITKIVQLGDFGLQSEGNIYAALGVNALSNALYTFVKANGGKTKLRNYTVLNYEHGYIRYYMKLAGIINIITLAKLFTVFIWGKLNEQ